MSKDLVKKLSKGDAIGYKQMHAIYKDLLTMKDYSKVTLLDGNVEMYKGEPIKHLEYTLTYIHNKKTYIHKSKNKFGNVNCCFGSMSFDSLGECKRYIDLLFLQRDGVIKDLQTQVHYNFIVNMVNVCDYVADFSYTVVNETRYNAFMNRDIVSLHGCNIVEDYKGSETKEFIIKEKLLLGLYGVVLLKTRLSDKKGAKVKKYKNFSKKERK